MLSLTLKALLGACVYVLIGSHGLADEPRSTLAREMAAPLIDWLPPTRTGAYTRPSGCGATPFSPEVIQEHGRALLAGEDFLSRGDKRSAEASFDTAVRHLAEFASQLYCLSTDEIRWWDHAIASYWDQDFPSPSTRCDALTASWNPAMLVLDMIQITGRSELVDQFQKREAELSGCLKSYPADSYGAAWLDQFGAGTLKRVSGRKALENLAGVLQDPSRLGLGLCGLIEHAGAAAGKQVCPSGLRPQMCGPEAGSPLEHLLELGIATLEFREELLPSGGIVYDTVSHFPPAYFGTPVEQMLSMVPGASSPTASLCAGHDGGIGGINARGLGCVYSMLEGLHEPNTGERVVACKKKYSTLDSSALVEPALKVDWNAYWQCGLVDPTTGGTNPKSPKDRQIVQAVYDTAAKLIKAGLVQEPDGSPVHPQTSARTIDQAMTKANNARKGSWTEAVDKMVADGMDRGEAETYAGYSDPDSSTIYVNPALGPREAAQTEFHERMHIALEDLGMSSDLEIGVAGADWGEDNTLHHIAMKRNGVYRPTPDSAGFAGCGQTAAAVKAHLTFDCMFSEAEPMITAGLAPWIRPHGPERLPSCDTVDMSRIWSDSTGDGVTDPVGPEDLARSGPIIVDYRALWNLPTGRGVTDPPKMLGSGIGAMDPDVMWLLGLRKNTPGDP